jgi:hypothetical protein
MYFGSFGEYVNTGFVDFLVSIFGWCKPPHHVKVNPRGEENDSATYRPKGLVNPPNLDQKFYCSIQPMGRPRDKEG